VGPPLKMVSKAAVFGCLNPKFANRFDRYNYKFISTNCLDLYQSNSSVNQEIIRFCNKASAYATAKQNLRQSESRNLIAHCYNAFPDTTQKFDEDLLDFCEKGNFQYEKKVACAKLTGDKKLNSYNKAMLLKCANKANETNVGCLDLALKETSDSALVEKLKSCEADLAHYTSDGDLMKRISQTKSAKKSFIESSKEVLSNEKKATEAK
jgi:hypothetical protein